MQWKESPFSHLNFLHVMKRNTLVCVCELEAHWAPNGPLFFPALWNLQNLRTAVIP